MISDKRETASFLQIEDSRRAIDSMRGVVQEFGGLGLQRCICKRGLWLDGAARCAILGGRSAFLAMGYVTKPDHTRDNAHVDIVLWLSGLLCAIKAILLCFFFCGTASRKHCER
ncbi:uncharacterized protein BDV17DRAFT_196316 [Aspergillus undulatus]|uniref:uncharacterized protein n=1 Tax=Aspergillus undulatus TaxID=1810928 RepID=UPI003CCD5253